VSLNGFVRQKIFGSPGRRAHRNPSSLDVATAQLAAQMGKGQSLLNQGIHAAHRIALGAPETNSRDRLADLLEDMFELLRPAVAENRECLAAAHALLRLRQDDAEGAF